MATGGYAASQRQADSEQDWGGRFQVSSDILREFIGIPMDVEYRTNSFFDERRNPPRTVTSRYADMDFLVQRVLRTDQDFYFPDDGETARITVRMGEVKNGALEEPRNDSGWGIFLNSLKKVYELKASSAPRDIANRYEQSKYAECLHMVMEEAHPYGNFTGRVWHAVGRHTQDVDFDSIPAMFGHINGTEGQEESGNAQPSGVRGTATPTGDLNLSGYAYESALEQINNEGMEWIQFRDILYRLYPNDTNFRKSAFMWKGGVKDYLVEAGLLRVEGESQLESVMFLVVQPEDITEEDMETEENKEIEVVPNVYAAG